MNRLIRSLDFLVLCSKKTATRLFRLGDAAVHLDDLTALPSVHSVSVAASNSFREKKVGSSLIF